MEAKFPSANAADLRTLEPWDGGGDSTTDVTLGGLEVKFCLLFDFICFNYI